MEQLLLRVKFHSSLYWTGRNQLQGTSVFPCHAVLGQKVQLFVPFPFALQPAQASRFLCPTVPFLPALCCLLCSAECGWKGDLPGFRLPQA